MPSLRRSFSTPAVRSTPYPSSSLVGTVRAHPRRPSSASDTTTRRILADIDWWRVEEGQCDPVPAEAAVQEEPEDEDEDVDMRPPQQPEPETAAGSTPAPALGTTDSGDDDGDGDDNSVAPVSAETSPSTVVERSSTPVHSSASPQLIFRAPRVHAMRMPMRHHASESSVSSIESSPDLPLTPRERFSFFDPGFATSDADDDLLPIVPAVIRALERVDFERVGKKPPSSMFTHDLLLHEDLFA